ncbi:MAG: hypothetical protein LC803_09430 [Acidobacteria bacterium]|nr:hypothetical protein [Acidobacteriota bacterium]
MKYQVWHVNDKLEDELLQEFDNEPEAMKYVLKLGDRSILATVTKIK